MGEGLSRQVHMYSLLMMFATSKFNPVYNVEIRITSENWLQSKGLMTVS